MKITIDPTKDNFIGNSENYSEDIAAWEKQKEQLTTPLREEIGGYYPHSTEGKMVINRFVKEIKDHLRLNIVIPDNVVEQKVYEFVNPDVLRQMKIRIEEFGTKYPGVDLKKYVIDFTVLGLYANLFIAKGAQFHSYIRERRDKAKMAKSVEREIDNFFIALKENGAIDISEVKFVGLKGVLSIKNEKFIQLMVNHFAEEYFYRVKNIQRGEWKEKYVKGDIPFITAKRKKKPDLQAEYFKKLFDIYFNAVNGSKDFDTLSERKKYLLLGDVIFTFCDEDEVFNEYGKEADKPKIKVEIEYMSEKDIEERRYSRMYKKHQDCKMK